MARIPGSGKPKGYKHEKTKEREIHNEMMRAALAEDFPDLYQALMQAAKGITHLMAREKDGTWKEVTDPKVMARVLNSGESFYRLTARNPDVNALRDCFNRLCGMPVAPKQQVEVSGSLTLEQLVTGAAMTESE